MVSVVCGARVPIRPACERMCVCGHFYAAHKLTYI